MNRECYLCKGQTFNQRSGSVRDGPELKVFECSSCGLVFLSSFAHIRDDFYKNSQMHASESIDIEDWISKTERDDERRFRYLENVLPNKAILDFGCGTGNFLIKAASVAREVRGIEPEERLRGHFGSVNLKVCRSILEVEPDETYDIITLFHMLEHIPDPREILIQLKQLLNEGGAIIVEVPSSDDALLTLYNCEPFSHFTYWRCHLFLFNAATLKELSLQSGFRINYTKQIQRYSLANHLFWLAKGKPGGHEEWGMLGSDALDDAYETKLGGLGRCDTVLVSLSIEG